MLKQLEIEPHPTYILNPEVADIDLSCSTVELDLETSGDTCWRDRVRVISIYTTEQYLLIPEFYQHDELSRFFQTIQDKGYLVTAHNAKFDIGFIYTHYQVLLTNVWCTLLGSQVIYGGSRRFRHDLGSVLRRELGVDLGEDKKELQKSFLNGRELTAEQLSYAANDTKYLGKLRECLLKKITMLDLGRVIKLEHQLLPVLVIMEAHGCPINYLAWQRKLREWEITKRDYLAKLDAEIMRVFPYSLFANVNYGSSKQMLDLFKRMGLPIPTKEVRKGREKLIKPSVDEDTLDLYVNENPDSPLVSFLTILKNYREYEKLLSTYGESFLARVDRNNHIHTQFTQCSTATGRLSSKNINCQNIPSDKSGSGSIIRQYFVAPPGYKFITCDMISAEMAIAADQSGDKVLTAMVLEGSDGHSKLASISASIIYGKKVTISKATEPIEVAPGISIIPNEFRDVHKSVTFSKFYKGGPPRIYGVLSRYIAAVVPAKQRMAIATTISKALDTELNGLAVFLDKKIKEANSQGYLITTKLGRRRYFDGKSYGDAANAPVQSPNGDAIKIAMINIHDYIYPSGIGRLALSVHDEVGVLVKEEYAEEVGEIVQQQMAQALTEVMYRLEGRATVHIGDYWEK
jgi:DNA polymerase I-like protein with 3'-5' exonuclease and polymerase domains